MDNTTETSPLSPIVSSEPPHEETIDVNIPPRKPKRFGKILGTLFAVLIITLIFFV